MIGDQRREPADDVGVAAEGEIGLDLLLERGDAQLVQALDLGLGERLVGDIGQGGAAPQRESALERAGGLLRAAGGELAATLGDELLEPVRVDPLTIERQPIAALVRDHDSFPLGATPVGRGQRLAQPRDLHIQRLARTGRRSLAPQVVDEPIDAQCLVDVEEQEHQQHALPAAAQCDDPTLVEHLEWTEDAEIHGGCTKPTDGMRAWATA